MLSRMAFNIYWSGRYLERAENVARFLAVNQDLSLEAHMDPVDMWQPLIQTTGDESVYGDFYDALERDDIIRFLAYDRNYASSICSSLRLARENARAVRHVLSKEMWLHMNALYLDIQEFAERSSCDEESLLAFLERVRNGCIGVHGMAQATMSRGEAWYWWQIGSMVERADKTSRILDVKYFMLLPSPQDVGTNIDYLQWIALLDSASASQMFRQTGHALNPAAVAAYLVLDQRFPRSLAYTMTKADYSLHAVTGTPQGQFCCDAERAVGRLRSELCFADIDAIIDSGLHEYLDGFQGSLNQVDQMLYTDFFGDTT